MAEKIGVLGGTFNPVHNGHIQLAETAYRQAGLDCVIFMPSGKSYMKRDLYVLPGEERLKLIDLSISDIPYFQTSDLELKRSGNTYTYETLEMLKEKNPSCDYYFIIGADCLFSMENWVNPRRIFDSCTIVAAVRNGRDKTELAQKAKELKERFDAKVILLDFEEISVSSSEIREKIKKGEPVDSLLPQKAADYLLTKGFFRV